MKRTLGDVQARPDYLIAGLSVVFGIFCLGGWYSTHQKLAVVNQTVVTLQKSLRFKVVSEKLIADPRAQELYESLLKDRKNGKILSPDFDAAADELKRRGVIYEPIDKELQGLYEEGRKRGFLKNDPEMQTLVTKAIKAGMIRDMSGGSVYPKPKTGVVQVLDTQTGKVHDVEYSGKRPTNEELIVTVEKRISGEMKGRQN
jgi:hypothetical protein